ncbi:hypothetical protein [Mesotoga sp. BH458_6_3_2_1]|uniref:hypothetical protein n=1 Tax=Mesotoga sp. BH458_6_3_2_1 TaxID=1437446 RepID=UPI000EF19D9F|nr:hypothetical protein [Mesotoga sp. BH458_6_3_2_1]RLL85910.1 hypothetical protein Y697_13850 [Mesotoga sp. BH458_6_3_2_1]
MNYIELINNFWIANKIHKFNSLETSLYFFVLDYANNARWPESFVLPNGIVQSIYGCTKGQLSRARRRLCKAGLITYESGDRFNPGKYSICAFPMDTRHVPDASPTETPTRAEDHIPKASAEEEMNTVDVSTDDRDESPTHPRCVPDTFSTDPNNINKTKLKKTKEKSTQLPNGNSSVRLTGESPISGELSTFSGVEEESEEEMGREEQTTFYAKDESDDGSRVFSSCEAQIEVDSPSSTSDEFPPERRSADFCVPYEKIRQAFIDLCPSLPAPKESAKWSGSRKRNVRARWKEYPSIEFWEDYFNSVEESEFLSGRVTRWRADFDWLMKPSNFEKVLEGKYSNRGDRMADVLRDFVGVGLDGQKHIR